MKTRKRRGLVLCILIVILLQGQVIWAEENSKTGIHLIFDNESGATIRLFLTSDRTGEGKIVKNNRTYLDAVQAGDVYSYKVSKNGYYSVTTAFVLTQQDIASQSKVIKVELEKRRGGGYEASSINRWTKEVEEKLFSLDELHEVYPEDLDTPFFRNKKNGHVFTTMEEGVSYLRELTGEGCYLYFMDREKTWPVMIYTKIDLSNVDDLGEALDKIADDGNLKIMYQAQIHGNEPAAGEGALLVAKTLSKDSAEYTENADIVLIPYVNRYGARHFTRYGNDSRLDFNRDAMALRSDSMKTIHWIYSKILPEVFIDGHELNGEYRFSGKGTERNVLKGVDDIQIACVNNLNDDPAVHKKEAAIMQNTVNSLKRKGFRSFFYEPSCNNTTSCSYARLHNSYTFLIESNGIGLGGDHFDRRVLSHREAIMSIVNQLKDEAATVKKTVRNARKKLSDRGKTYSKSDKFVLKHGKTGSNGIKMARPYFDFFGNSIEEKLELYYNTDISLKSRTRPTAYIMPKDVPGASRVRRILAINGVRYFTLGKNTEVPVQRYSGTVTQAKVGKTKAVSFKQGAYVFYMDQEAANIISASMEPDVGDTAGFHGSFVQSGVLRRCDDGGYPIYRCKINNPQTNLNLKITQWPSSTKPDTADKARFSVAASGTNLSYQWYYRVYNSRKWKKCTSASSVKRSLIVNHAKQNKKTRYKCIISNGKVRITSNVVYIK